MKVERATLQDTLLGFGLLVGLVLGIVGQQLFTRYFARGLVLVMSLYICFQLAAYLWIKHGDRLDPPLIEVVDT